jgi:ABC-type nitrate/sulfonate/bicarbonate transport system substrate-binding protein
VERCARQTAPWRAAARSRFGFHFPRRLLTRESPVWGIALAFAAATCTAQDLAIAVSRSSMSLPVFVADSQKFFADEGVAVTTRECIGGHRCIKLMLDGEVPLATAAEMPVMLNSFARSDFAIVATFVTSKRDVKLIARKSTGITTASDLSGKRIGTVKGTSAHYFLDTFLLFNAVDPRRVELVPLAPEQIADALGEGRIDAAAIWEPFANRSMRALSGDAVVIPSARIYTETFNLLASHKFVAERETDLVKVLRALVRAQRFIRERPRQAQAILKERLQEDQGFVDATWNDFDYRMSLSQPLVSTLEGQARWAVREGYVGRDRPIPNFLHFVAPEPLRKVEPSAVTLVK